MSRADKMKALSAIGAKSAFAIYKRNPPSGRKGFDLKADAPYVIGHDQLPHGVCVLRGQNGRVENAVALGIQRIYLLIPELKNIRRLWHHLNLDHVDGHQTAVVDVDGKLQVDVISRLFPLGGLLTKRADERIFLHGFFQGGKVPLLFRCGNAHR